MTKQHAPVQAHGPARARPFSEARVARSAAMPSRTAAQAKLEVGPVDDPFEREADLVASEVVSRIARSGDDGETPPLRAPDRTATRVRRSAGADGGSFDGGAVDVETERGIDAARGGGTALPEHTRSSMESAFQTDFSAVRIHANARELNERLQAKAFTVGNDIFFRDGAPGASPADQHLLAHELTHTVQQGATLRIQRMPSLATVKSDAGKKSKSGVKIFGKQMGATSTYNAFLDAVKVHENYLNSTPLANARLIMQQVDIIDAHVGSIVATAQAYLAKEDADPNVAAVCQNLIDMAPLEKAAARDIGAFFAQNLGKARVKWVVEMPRDPANYRHRMADTRADAVTAKVGGTAAKGNNKEVSEVTNSSGAHGRFATDDKTGKYAKDEAETWENPKWLMKNYGTKDNLALGNRSIAMSRLDKLLGAGVIARTERALKGDTLGTFQWEAEGIVGKKALDPTQGGIDPNDDANLARLMPRLHLIDLIASQVDRHAGNYFVKTDRSGKVVGITGIDLDMAWSAGGGRFEADLTKGSIAKSDGGKVDHLPGFSRFVDKELAEKIITLDPNDLIAILMDLLTPAEVQAAVSRLMALQDMLKALQAQGALLKPNEWTQHVRAQVVNEKSSYFARAAG